MRTYSRTIENPPPYDQAAELVTEKLWLCRVCGKAWSAERAPGDTFDPEQAARACHTGQRPCGKDGCTDLTVPHHTYCRAHLEESRDVRWAKRARAPHVEGPVWSDTLEEWFDDVDAAYSRAFDTLEDEKREASDAAVRAELERMRLRLGKPVCARPFDVMAHIDDLLPTEDEFDEQRLKPLNPIVEKLNEALEQLGTLSWTVGEEAVDLDAYFVAGANRAR